MYRRLWQVEAGDNGAAFLQETTFGQQIIMDKPDSCQDDYLTAPTEDHLISIMNGNPPFKRIV
ncbi:MAG: hypothetical protein K2X49_26250 [Acetobacteraceae bacterium]|nr:hypothetical protein [Acetobacteraceae bacterium]